MADVEELKELIVDLKMHLVRGTIPSGHCPYAYTYGIAKPKEDTDCDDCFSCKRRFFEQYEAKVRDEVAAL